MRSSQAILRRAQSGMGARGFTLIELLVVIAIIDDGHFGFAPEGDIWMNLPATWHNSGCNFSFADGHVELFKWRDPRTLALKVINTVRTPNNPDLRRLQAIVATKN
jgi:prepilin-type processing-associated H-X9-DG protein